MGLRETAVAWNAFRLWGVAPGIEILRFAQNDEVPSLTRLRQVGLDRLGRVEGGTMEEQTQWRSQVRPLVSE